MYIILFYQGKRLCGAWLFIYLFFFLRSLIRILLEWFLMYLQTHECEFYFLGICLIFFLFIIFGRAKSTFFMFKLVGGIKANMHFILSVSHTALRRDIPLLVRRYLRLYSQISPLMAYHVPINSANGYV